MTLSLRGRLLIGVISLVVIGLLVANVAMYLSLQTFLMGRVDDQLANGVDEAANALGATAPLMAQSPTARSWLLSERTARRRDRTCPGRCPTTEPTNPRRRTRSKVRRESSSG